MGNSELTESFIVNQLKQQIFHEEGSEITPEMMEFTKTKINGKLHKKDGTIEIVELNAEMIRESKGLYKLNLTAPTGVSDNAFDELTFKLKVD